MAQFTVREVEGMRQVRIDMANEATLKFKSSIGTGFRAPTAEFIDGVTYDGTKPNAYLASFKIGNNK